MGWLIGWVVTAAMVLAAPAPMRERPRPVPQTPAQTEPSTPCPDHSDDDARERDADHDCKKDDDDELDGSSENSEHDPEHSENEPDNSEQPGQPGQPGDPKRRGLPQSKVEEPDTDRGGEGDRGGPTPNDVPSDSGDDVSAPSPDGARRPTSPRSMDPDPSGQNPDQNQNPNQSPDESANKNKQPPQIPPIQPPGGGGGDNPEGGGGGGGGGKPKGGGGGGGGGGGEKPSSHGQYQRDPDAPETPAWLAAQLAEQSANLRDSLDKEAKTTEAEIDWLAEQKKSACTKAGPLPVNGRYFVPGLPQTMKELCECLEAYESQRALASRALNEAIKSWDEYWEQIKKIAKADLAGAVQALACAREGGDCWEQYLARHGLGLAPPANPTRGRHVTPCTKDPDSKPDAPWANRPATPPDAPDTVQLPVDLCSQVDVLRRAQNAVGREHSAVIRPFNGGAQAVDNIVPGHLTSTRIDDSDIKLRNLRDGLIFHTHPTLPGGVPTFSGPDFATTVQSPAAGHLLTEGNNLFMLMRTSRSPSPYSPQVTDKRFRSLVEAQWKAAVLKSPGSEADAGRAAVRALAQHYGFAYYEGSGCTLTKVK